MRDAVFKVVAGVGLAPGPCDEGGDLSAAWAVGTDRQTIDHGRMHLPGALGREAGEADLSVGQAQPTARVQPHLLTTDSYVEA